VEQIESKACLLENDEEEEGDGKQSKTQGKNTIWSAKSSSVLW